MAQPIATWLQGSPLNIVGQAHDIPKNLDKYLSKYKHDGLRLFKEHIQAYTDTLARLQVQHEDMNCHMFSMILYDEAYDWYIDLPLGSITSWNRL